MRTFSARHCSEYCPRINPLYRWGNCDPGSRTTCLESLSQRQAGRTSEMEEDELKLRQSDVGMSAHWPPGNPTPGWAVLHLGLVHRQTTVPSAHFWLFHKLCWSPSHYFPRHSPSWASKIREEQFSNLSGHQTHLRNRLKCRFPGPCRSEKGPEKCTSNKLPH